MKTKEFFINFSGLYSDFPTGIAGRSAIDLTSLDGTNCYCSDDASDAIRKALSEVPSEALHWIDTGDYHYASLFFLEKIRTPYTLFLFDHHPDDQDSAFGTDILSCGNWVARARQLPNQTADFLIDRFPNPAAILQPVTTAPQTEIAGLQPGTTAPQTEIAGLQSGTTALQTEIAGPLPVTTAPHTEIAGLQSVTTAPHTEIAGLQLETTAPQTRTAGLQSVTTAPQTEITVLQGNSKCGCGKGERQKAYLSIDKDVMCRDSARTNWDQGDMTLQELKDLIIRISYKYDIIGADVCGGLIESKGAGAEDLKINCATDAELRELLLNLMIV